VHDRDGLLERLPERAIEQAAGLRAGHAADVGARDGHALGDAVLAR
jgi:hypothetical protein